jgi:WD40 repeat protein
MIMQGDCILYDFLQPAEWDVHGDYQRSEPPSSLLTHFVAFARGSVSLLLKLLRLPFSGQSQDVCQSLISLLESRIAWQLDLSRDGCYLAILGDNQVEILSAATKFEIAKKVEIDTDLYPHWRKLTWSPDGDVVVCVSSSGRIHLVSASGGLLLSSAETDMKSTKFNMFAAPAGVQCVKCRAQSDGLFQVIVVTYEGLLKNYLIKSKSECTLQHTFSFSACLPGIVAAVQYSEKHNVLLIGSCSYEDKKSSGESHIVSAVTSWRLLDGAPFYIRALEDSPTKSHRNQARLLRRFTQGLLNKTRVSHQDLVFQMALSPNGSLLATLDCEGKLSILRMPSLVQYCQWTFQDQPDGKDAMTVPMPWKHKMGPDFYVNISWWSDESVILARRSGAVTVASIDKNLVNLLGSVPEQFEPGCSITHSTGSSFFILECEGTVKKNRLLSFGDDGKAGSVDAGADEEVFVKRVMRDALFYLTESDRFRPRGSRPRVVHRSYHLFWLQSMTAEKLFHRKIEQENYGEAVALAQRFGLDANLVYRTQWQACQVSKASISDYLAKISDVLWVLQECQTRFPDSYDATRVLILFGLSKTNIWDVIDENEQMHLEIHSERSPTKKEAESLKRLNINKLSDRQMFLCQCRCQLFSNLDRLSTYEVVLGGPVAAGENFSKQQFQLFCSRTLLESAISYAQNGDWRAVHALFTHHGDAVLGHWLAIVSCFPETMTPNEYQSLLPEISLDDPNRVVEWEQEPWRTADWVEKEDIRSVLDKGRSELDDSITVCHEKSSVEEGFDGSSPLSVEVVGSWYQKRAEEIEKLSGQVENALQLVRLGIGKGVTSLETLRDDLLTLETIVYDCGSASYLSLDGLRALPYNQQLEFIMEKSLTNTKQFVSWFKKFALPFLDRIKHHHPATSFCLMKDFLVEKSVENMELCLAVCKESNQGRASLIDSKADLMEIALACIYACDRTDQLHIAFEIFECLPSRDTSEKSERMLSLHSDVDRLDDILLFVDVWMVGVECVCLSVVLWYSGTKLLQGNEVKHPVHFLKGIEKDVSAAHQLMVKLSRSTSRKSPPPSEQEWRQVLRDMLTLQQRVFTCLGPSVCYNVFAESLLCCGRLEGIALAGSLLTSSGKEKIEKSKGARSEKERGGGFALRLSFKKSTELVLSAAREYFNSATSLTDKDMDLAKACLALIEDRPHDIQAELDLISALGVLSDFGVKMLPLQVRLAQKKLSIIQEALKQPKAYKSPTKLEKLGQLLGISSVCEVRVLIGETAIHNEDYKVASTICQLLMDEKHTDGWHVCRQLGECSKFDDLRFRKELIAFALTHCPDDQIETLLRASGVLEVQAMLVDTAKQQEGSSLQTTWTLVGLGAGAVHGLVERGAGAVSGLVSRSAGAVESLVASRMDTRVTRSAGELMNQCLSWMQKTSKLVRRSTGQRDDVNSNQQKMVQDEEEFAVEGTVGECLVQASHPFYGSCTPSDSDLQHSFDYTLEERYEDGSQQVVVNSNLIRMAKLTEAQCKGETIEPTGDALIQLAADTLHTDLSLSLSYLLALHQPELAEELFQQLPPTQLSLQLAIYFYSLNIYIAATAAKHLPPQPTQHPYHHSPTDLVRHVTEIASQRELLMWPVELQNMMCQLIRHQEKLTDFRYIEKLKQLDSSMDGDLFAQDEKYRKQTALNLSRSVDDEMYCTSLAVAKRYNIPLFDVLFCHLSWLITKSRMSVSVVEQRLQSLNVLPELLKEPEKFADCLRVKVYPELPGSNLNGLLCYYTLLLQCIEHGARDENPVTVETHIKLLKRLKQAVSGLDYKMLMCGYDVEEVLRPVLSSGNVHVFAKTSNCIPVQGTYLTPSGVFLIYCKKLFWEGEGKPSDESKPWVHRYESCQELAHRLTAGHFSQLVDDIVCSQQAIQLPLETRMDIVRRSVKFAKGQISGKKKMMEATEETEGFSIEFIHPIH